MWHDQCGSEFDDRPIRVAIVNDYELVVEGVRAMLAPFADRVTVVETEVDGQPDSAPDVALFDTFAARRHSLERVRQMAGNPRIGKVVLYTWDVPEEFRNELALCEIDAVILKSVTGADLVRALEQVHRGEYVPPSPNSTTIGAPLSEREREVLTLLGRGYSNRQIAHELYLSVNTVKTHVASVFTKLDVDNRTQAAAIAIQSGLAATGRSA